MQPDFLPSSIGSAPPCLPDDLLQAFTAADYLIAKVDSLNCLFGDEMLVNASGEDSLNARSLRCVAVSGVLNLQRKLPAAAAAIQAVSNEITAINRTPVRLALATLEWNIEPNAHQAAFSLARCFLETLLNSLQPPMQIIAARNELLPLRR